MTVFRAIDPRGVIVATRNFNSAEDAHRWFAEAVAGRYQLGWRMEVCDDGQWAGFDDTGGFTAPLSRRRVPSRANGPVSPEPGR
ncbi:MULTISPECIES: hypothetical protein [Mycobacterium]|uniref:hypothetical protein n=1 Tax=Mycobacterium TaxID=1763 RepID=UPI0009F1D2A8|nr:MULTISPECIES: hypothetical protein [Mycobacterium]MCQ4365732.1 hypothetical protein [Mycobacterium gordonae]PJE06100.1 MAG: hypothetical protein CK429_28490 [Mycobacterium sp.]PJE17236.1 MAG: hypothetical protein CK428_00595 [Mycobacterium sp.]